MRKVETQVIWPDKGAFLFNMLTQNFAQRIMKQMRCRMVVGCSRAPFGINNCPEISRWVFGQVFYQMHNQVVFLACIKNLNVFVSRRKGAGITGLAATFGIKRGAVENQLINFFPFGGYFAETRDFYIRFGGVISHKFSAFRSFQFMPVVGRNRGIAPRTVFLFFQLQTEIFHVHVPAQLTAHQLGKVNRETEGVVHLKSKFTVYQFLIGMRGNILVEFYDPCCKCTQERRFLFGNYPLYKLQVTGKFGERFAHLFFQNRNQFVHQRFAHVQERIGIADRAAEYAADNITSFYIGWQLSIGNGKYNSPEVVGNYAHGHITFMVTAVSNAGNPGYFGEQRCENVCIVIALGTLQHHAQAFEAHAGINMFCRERNQRTVRLSVVLNKNVVPYFDNLRMVVVYKLVARDFCFFRFFAYIHMYFRTWATRTGIAHFPEIVFFRATQDSILGNIFLPYFECFGIFGHVVGGIATENGNVQLFLINFIYFG